MLLIDKIVVAGGVQLNLRGQLQAPGSDQLASVVREALGRRGVLVVLNLEQVTALDAAGLGALATVRGLVDGWGGRITLLNPDRRFATLLTVVGLDVMFDISPDVDPEADGLEKDEAVGSTIP